ncbi:MAG: ATP:cob(I)alamin adenosyltransferase [Candidatus Peregrinibacteria bacterium GW2011_GWC2_39_14]|nr:MAG: ATP/cobalamin adenosyltransferase [Candidatus Peregrinibacteria bacterium GW2011_GWA2_38_36]KKR07144.1 MAG: ATP:cob(I)alamin adenosyltransferase [Candidatus Peregrinibacteria bacterium GW2011_GWC2_39_14]
MKISTRKGDKGKTRLGDGKEVFKDAKFIETLGEIDEFNSRLGEIIALNKWLKKEGILSEVQKKMLVAGAEIAEFKGCKKISADDLKLLENEIEKLEKKLPELKNFIIPGGNVVSAKLHVARTLCRKIERRIVAIEKKKLAREKRKSAINKNLIPYFNRLSDLIFLLARKSNRPQG